MTALDTIKLKARFEWWAPFRPGHPSFYRSHSQFGEDMAVRALFGDRQQGTYVDVGAHHPVYYSNTYHFYRRGWRGLNIDALPGSMEQFRALRREDVNLETCIAPIAGQHVTLHLFENTAFSTIDADLARKHAAAGERCLGTRQLACATLNECLDKHLPGRHIDLLSIDIEGLDEAILRSNDWARCTPSVLVFERHDLSLNAVNDDPFMRFLYDRGYDLEGKCGPSFVMSHRSLAR